MAEQSERLAQTVHLAMKGISFAQNAQRVAELLNRIDDNDAEEDGRVRLQRAQAETALAGREVSQGFPVLHAQAVVTQWAYLEACVRRLLADWVQNEPSCLGGDAFQKVRVRLADYERLDGIDKAFFVVDAFERENGAGLQNGVDRFETLLSAVGLNADVPAALKRLIFELGQVRNVILHRGGVVDRKFSDACPWLGVKVDDQLQVTHTKYAEYGRAVQDYFTLLICRVGDRFGVEVHDERSAILARYTRASDVPDAV
jgi:hypothetical protein